MFSPQITGRAGATLVGDSGPRDDRGYNRSVTGARRECSLVMPLDKVTIKIPRPLYQKIQKVIEGSSFSSPTDFIVYVLRDLVGELKVDHAEERLTESEINAIRRRLRSLGYL